MTFREVFDAAVIRYLAKHGIAADRIIEVDSEVFGGWDDVILQEICIYYFPTGSDRSAYFEREGTLAGFLEELE